MSRRLLALTAVVVCVVWTGCGDAAREAAQTGGDATPQVAAQREAPTGGESGAAAAKRGDAVLTDGGAEPAMSPGPADPGAAAGESEALEPAEADMSAEHAPAEEPAAEMPAPGGEGGGLGGMGFGGGAIGGVSGPGSHGAPPASMPAAPGEPAPSAPPPADEAALPLKTAEAKGEGEARGGRAPRNQIQSGTLTAGSFDDHDRLDDFQEFVSQAISSDAHEVLPRIERGRRVLVRVVNEEDKPVGDARVVVRRPGEGKPVLEAPTASDGRTFFMAGRQQKTEFDVEVTPPGGSEPVKMKMTAEQSPWRITLPQTAAALPTKLDLALVIDCTGSMSDELEYLKVEIDAIAQSIHEMFPNVDQRYALVVYRDQGDEYVFRTFDFTGSLEEFRRNLAAQRANGGGDYPEAVHQAMEEATGLSWRDKDTARVLFLVADAPPHDNFAKQTIDAVEVLRDCCVRVYPVASSGVRTKAEFIMRATAFLTMGKYLFLTDHSGVGNPHAKPHVPEYKVERLDRLMIRMIASELAGRHLEADEVIAIEQGDVRFTEPEAVEPEPQEPGIPHETGVRSPGAGLWASLLPQAPAWTWLAVAAALLFGFDAAADRWRR